MVRVETRGLMVEAEEMGEGWLNSVPGNGDQMVLAPRLPFLNTPSFGGSFELLHKPAAFFFFFFLLLLAVEMQGR